MKEINKPKMDIETARLMARVFGDRIYNDIIITVKGVKEKDERK